jgi:hypothetical protein
LVRLGFALPNENMPPPSVPAERRMSQIQSAMSRTAGPKLTSRLCHNGGPAGGLAVTTTPFCCSSRSRLSVLAKSGTWVENWLVVVALVSFAG